MVFPGSFHRDRNERKKGSTSLEKSSVISVGEKEGGIFCDFIRKPGGGPRWEWSGLVGNEKIVGIGDIEGEARFRIFNLGFAEDIGETVVMETGESFIFGIQRWTEREKWWG